MVGDVGLWHVVAGADHPAIPWGVALGREQAVEHGGVDCTRFNSGVVDGFDEMG